MEEDVSGFSQSRPSKIAAVTLLCYYATLLPVTDGLTSANFDARCFLDNCTTTPRHVLLPRVPHNALDR